MYHQISDLDEKLAKNSELVTDIDIRLREIKLDVRDLGARDTGHYKQLSKENPTENLRKDMGFKKKKSAKSSVNKSEIEPYSQRHHAPSVLLSNNMKKSNQQSKNNSVSNTRRMLFPQFEGFPQSIKEEGRLSISSGLDETMLEEVKTLIEAILQQKNYTSYQQLIEEIGNLRGEYERDLQVTGEREYKKLGEEIQIKTAKELQKMQTYFTERLELHEKNLIENEIRFTKKIREDHEWIIDFVENNCLMQNQFETLLNQHRHALAIQDGFQGQEPKKDSKSQIKDKKKNHSHLKMDKSKS